APDRRVADLRLVPKPLNTKMVTRGFLLLDRLSSVRFAVVSGTLAARCGVAAARPASPGWFAEGGLGAVAFLPKASRDANLGPSLDLRIGRDLVSWLSVGITIG